VDQKEFIVAFDDVALQLGDTGIARYWRELVNALVEFDILKEHSIKPIFLSRSAFRTNMYEEHLEFPSFDFRFAAADRQLISAFCKSEKVDLFVSSYYTFSTVSANLILVYDLIPEVFTFGRMNRGWMERELAINAASSFFTISNNTRKDLGEFYPHSNDLHIGVGHPGIDSKLFAARNPSVDLNLTQGKRYFVCVGSRYGEGGYKNGKLLVGAINLIPKEDIDFELYFIGGEPLTQEELKMQSGKGIRIHTGRFSDSEMVSVIRNAEALVYPSKYEGFGIPPLEALSLGTPVITTRCSSIPEAVGDLALFVETDDGNQLAELLLRKDFAEVRDSLIISGPQRAREFTWEKTAREFGSTLVHSLTTQQSPAWKKRQEILHEYSQIAINLQH
jgi:glycosyltransferase involved in cell wall biosynthesis